MLKYHTKQNVIDEAQKRGSFAKTYHGALRFLRKNIIKPGLPLEKCGHFAYSLDRGKQNRINYKWKKRYVHAQLYCDDLGLVTRDVIEAQNQKRRDAYRKKMLVPYWDAAHFATPSAIVDQYLNISDYNPKKRMALFIVDDWVKYSNRETWHVDLAILVIYDRDSGQYNSIRVSPQCRNINDALIYLKPAEVKKAEAAGKKIKRQGDMYFIPQRSWNLTELFGSHHIVEIQVGRSGFWMPWDRSEKLNGKLIKIIHPHHKSLTLTEPHKAKQQITVFGRSHAMAD